MTAPAAWTGEGTRHEIHGGQGAAPMMSHETERWAEGKTTHPRPEGEPSGGSTDASEREGEAERDRGRSSVAESAGSTHVRATASMAKTPPALVQARLKRRRAGRAERSMEVAHTIRVD